MKTNLVIATWSGLRRLKSEPSQDEFQFSNVFLKKQIFHLKRIKHKLSQITFVVPENANESKEFRYYLNNIPSQINNTKVVVLERSNIGLSYGSFSHAFEIYKKSFDYYIFLEDDYIFVEDNFDETLIRIFTNSKNCGYLSGMVYKGPIYPDHPSNFNGITTSNILSELWDKYGKLPHATDSIYVHAENNGQVAYGEQIVKLGYELFDLTPYYGVPFMCFTNGVIPHGQKNSKFIFIPSQMVTRRMLCNKIKLI
jgi:hypothetical protein